jgi:hypothetical protein
VLAEAREQPLHLTVYLAAADQLTTVGLGRAREAAVVVNTPHPTAQLRAAALALQTRAEQGQITIPEQGRLTTLAAEAEAALAALAAAAMEVHITVMAAEAAEALLGQMELRMRAVVGALVKTGRTAINMFKVAVAVLAVAVLAGHGLITVVDALVA